MTFFATVRRKSGEIVRSEPTLGPDAIAEKRQRILTALRINATSLETDDLAVEHIMSTSLSTVVPDSQFSEIKKKMARQKLRHLLVVEPDGRLVGIISDRDVLRRNGIFAKQVMTTSPLSAAPQTKVRHAVNIMLTRRISCLPIVDDEKPVGILTTTDIMMAFQSVLEMLSSPKPSGGIAEFAQANLTAAAVSV
jgi:acetoin utilization protein AcuB